MARDRPRRRLLGVRGRGADQAAGRGIGSRRRPPVASASTDLTLTIAAGKVATRSGLHVAVGGRRIAGVGEYRAAEPLAWQASATDATAALQVPGTIGANAYLSSGATNAPIRLSLDDLVARVP